MKKGFLIVLLSVLLLMQGTAFGKLFVDISAPGGFKLPIAVVDFLGMNEASLVSDVVRQDLISSGYFTVPDKSTYLETSNDPFTLANWKPLGIEAVAKATLSGSRDNMELVFTLYDAVEDKVILKKKYTSTADLVRPLGHKIASDIFKAITGQEGIFSSKLAFVVNGQSSGSIYIMDWDGERTQKVLTRSGEIMRPIWIPSTNKLAYSSLRDKRWIIYTFDLGTATEKEIYSSDRTDLAGDFSRDGSTLYFSSTKSGSPDILSLNLMSGAIKQIAASRFIEVSPKLSPDGRRIAFVSDASGSPQIYVMSVDGYNKQRLTFQGSYNTSPDWSYAGDKIVYTGIKGGQFHIFTMNVDGSNVTQLTTEGDNEEPAFSPDGLFIAFVSSRGGGKGIYIMNSDGTNQRRVSQKSFGALGPAWSTE